MMGENVEEWRERERERGELTEWVIVLSFCLATARLTLSELSNRSVSHGLVLSDGDILIRWPSVVNK